MLAQRAWVQHFLQCAPGLHPHRVWRITAFWTLLCPLKVRVSSRRNYSACETWHSSVLCSAGLDRTGGQCVTSPTSMNWYTVKRGHYVNIREDKWLTESRSRVRRCPRGEGPPWRWGRCLCALCRLIWHSTVCLVISGVFCPHWVGMFSN